MNDLLVVIILIAAYLVLTFILRRKPVRKPEPEVWDDDPLMLILRRNKTP